MENIFFIKILFHLKKIGRLLPIKDEHILSSILFNEQSNKGYILYIYKLLYIILESKMSNKPKRFFLHEKV